MSDVELLTEIVKTINDCWLGGRFDELHEYFDENMVLAMPGFEERVTGAARIIESYRQFARAAQVQSFHAQEPIIDVEGQTAIATTNFNIVYEIKGATYHESGADLLVFQKSDESWRVIWRTVVMTPGDAPSQQ